MVRLALFRLRGWSLSGLRAVFFFVLFFRTGKRNLSLAKGSYPRIGRRFPPAVKRRKASQLTSNKWRVMWFNMQDGMFYKSMRLFSTSQSKKETRALIVQTLSRYSQWQCGSCQISLASWKQCSASYWSQKQQLALIKIQCGVTFECTLAKTSGDHRKDVRYFLFLHWGNETANIVASTFITIIVCKQSLCQ